MKLVKKEKILVAMSGGVDSSVAAALLCEEGYDVTGVFMVNYDENDSCWRSDYQDAVRVAAKLEIPLLRMNFTKEYKKMVLDYMYGEYKKGRTPNPDVLCNKYIKFGVWLDAMKKLGFSKLATGHYARLRYATSGQTSLMQAKDNNKDQTYFLNQLNQKQLKHVLFPIGDYSKSEVRKLAKKFKLPTAEKEESMGICFIGEVPMKEFLSKKIKVKKGEVVMSNGEVVGEHDGLAFYTIGQRHLSLKHKNIKTLKQNETEPLYVVGKNIIKNQLIVGYENDPLLYKKEIEVENTNWIGGQKPRFPLKCEVRLRHRQPLQKTTVKEQKKDTVLITFEKPQRAPTAGQFAVIYSKGACLGGGVIQ